MIALTGSAITGKTLQRSVSDEQPIRKDVAERQQYRLEYSFFEDDSGLTEQKHFSVNTSSLSDVCSVVLNRERECRTGFTSVCAGSDRSPMEILLAEQTTFAMIILRARTSCCG
ncbi:hypothetical protein AB7C87_08020, partial [Natrarchaeobius sp. A-rgal3]|uniref:hypothetical protein n=1 Tax=Natrarchaeobius versutus TaxID=1679078 RepID=UPI00350EFAAF